MKTHLSMVLNVKEQLSASLTKLANTLNRKHNQLPRKRRQANIHSSSTLTKGPYQQKKALDANKKSLFAMNKQLRKLSSDCQRVIRSVQKLHTELNTAAKKTTHLANAIQLLETINQVLRPINKLNQQMQSLTKQKGAAQTLTELNQRMQTMAKQKGAAQTLTKVNQHMQSMAKQKGAAQTLTKVNRQMQSMAKQKGAAQTLTKVNRQMQSMTKQKGAVQTLTELNQKMQSMAKQKGAAQTLTKFNQKIQTIAKGTEGIFNNAGKYASVLFNATNAHAKEMSQQGKVAKKLNIPVEDLQVLQFQAEVIGIDTRVMEDALLSFSDQLGKLQITGNGRLAQYLKKSGNHDLLNALKKEKDTNSAYQLLLDEFQKLQTAQEKMALAKAAFSNAENANGQNGQQMLGLVSTGKKGHTEARDEFEQLGLLTSKKDIQAAIEYSQTLARLEAVFDSVKTSVLLPVIKMLTQEFKTFLNHWKNADFREDVIGALIETIKGLCNAVIFISKYFSEFIAVVALLKIGMIALNAVTMSNPFALIVAGISAAIVAISYLIHKFDVIALASSKWNEWFGDDAAKTRQTTTQGITDYRSHSSTTERYDNIAKVNSYQPLSNPTLNNKSSVTLKIHSDKPVTVDKTLVDKNTDLNLNVGDLAGVC